VLRDCVLASVIWPKVSVSVVVSEYLANSMVSRPANREVVRKLVLRWNILLMLYLPRMDVFALI